MYREEVWAVCPRHPSYEVSSFGRVRSITRVVTRSDGIVQTRHGKLLKQYPHKGGYLAVVLGAQQVHAYVHILVLEAFLYCCPPGMECRHLDGNSGNNRADNLSWGTPQQNAEDKRRHGTLAMGSDYRSAKLTEDAVRLARELYSSGRWTYTKLATRFGISYPNMRKAIRGETWRHVI